MFFNMMGRQSTLGDFDSAGHDMTASTVGGTLDRTGLRQDHGTILMAGLSPRRYR